MDLENKKILLNHEAKTEENSFLTEGSPSSNINGNSGSGCM